VVKEHLPKGTLVVSTHTQYHGEVGLILKQTKAPLSSSAAFCYDVLWRATTENDGDILGYSPNNLVLLKERR